MAFSLRRLLPSNADPSDSCDVDISVSVDVAVADIDVQTLPKELPLQSPLPPPSPKPCAAVELGAKTRCMTKHRSWKLHKELIEANPSSGGGHLSYPRDGPC